MDHQDKEVEVDKLTNIRRDYVDMYFNNEKIFTETCSHKKNKNNLGSIFI